MEAMFVLIGFSLMAAAGFMVSFILALRRGQFDDLTTPPLRMLFDSETTGKKSDKSQE